MARILPSEMVKVRTRNSRPRGASTTPTAPSTSAARANRAPRRYATACFAQVSAPWTSGAAPPRAAGRARGWRPETEAWRREPGRSRAWRVQRPGVGEGGAGHEGAGEAGGGHDLPPGGRGETTRPRRAGARVEGGRHRGGAGV